MVIIIGETLVPSVLGGPGVEIGGALFCCWIVQDFGVRRRTAGHPKEEGLVIVCGIYFRGLIHVFCAVGKARYSILLCHIRIRSVGGGKMEPIYPSVYIIK